jgi:hypothetical protein
MTDDKSSRRAFLRYGAIGAAAALAGCQGDDGDDSPNGEQNGEENGDDNGTENGETEEQDYSEAFDLAGDGAALFGEWLVPDNPWRVRENITSICGFRDFEAEDAEGIDWMAARRDELSEIFQVDSAAFAGELFVGDPGSSRERTIYFGEFDPEAIVETFENAGTASQVDEYGEYLIIEGQQGRGAVGPDAILILPIYDQYIDAKNGDSERLAEADEGVSHVLDVLPRGFQLSLSRHSNLEDLAVNGSTFHDIEGRAPNRTTRAFVFHEEADATVDRALEIIEIGQTGAEEVLTEEQHGRMVMIEYTQDWGGQEALR